MKVSVVMPVFNEETTIAETSDACSTALDLGLLIDALPGWDAAVLVDDRGPESGLRYEKNMGKGRDPDGDSHVTGDGLPFRMRIWNTIPRKSLLARAD
jgi:glycosyltransferase involved in cell wall biosynthesis